MWINEIESRFHRSTTLSASLNESKLDEKSNKTLNVNNDYQLFDDGEERESVVSDLSSLNYNEDVVVSGNENEGINASNINIKWVMAFDKEHQSFYWWVL